MKHRRVLTLALALSVISMSLVSSDSTAKAQTTIEWMVLSVVTLGPNQMLRITAVNTDKNKEIRVGFRRMEYTLGTCNAGVCKLALASQTTSNPVTLAPGEAASIDIANTSFGVSGGVLSSSRDLKVTAFIVDTTTGAIVSQIALGDGFGAIG